MRIRMKRHSEEEIDGVSLDALETGLVYDVTATLGTYLVTTGQAVPAPEHLIDRRVAANIKHWRAVAKARGT